jgi:hypothetical protein
LGAPSGGMNVGRAVVSTLLTLLVMPHLQTQNALLP